MIFAFGKQMMKKLKGDNIINKLVISLVVILLLISPCSVRNYLQISFGVETDKPINPNKSNVPQAFNYSCSAENAVQTFRSSVSKKQLKENQVAFSNSYKYTFEFEEISNASYSKGGVSKQSIPYYILYKRFKNYGV